MTTLRWLFLHLVIVGYVARSISLDYTGEHPDGGSTTVSVHGSVPKVVIVVAADLDHGGVVATRCSHDEVQLLSSQTTTWWQTTAVQGEQVCM
jgi:hypothetical protein